DHGEIPFPRRPAPRRWSLGVGAGRCRSADLDLPPAMRTKRRVLAAVILLPLNLGVFAAGSKTPGRSVTGKLKPCHVPGVDEEVRCGRYEVYEDRAARKGRKIGLNIVVLPAKGTEVAADPLVFLAGGGVGPATRYAGFLSEAYSNLPRHPGIVLVA